VPVFKLLGARQNKQQQCFWVSTHLPPRPTVREYVQCLFYYFCWIDVKEQWNLNCILPVNQLVNILVYLCMCLLRVIPMELYLNNHNGKTTFKRPNQTQEVTLWPFVVPMS
jgi:hypothetical protein